MSPAAEPLPQPGIARRDGAPLYRHEAIAAVLQVRNGQLCVLLRQRTRAPFAGLYALPSGAVEVSETIDAAVIRHLGTKAGITSLSYLEQLGTQSAPRRDPAQRTIGTSYLGLLPALTWTQSEPATAPGTVWAPVAELPELGFDHGATVTEAVERLRAKLSYTNLGFALIDGEFTIAQLREVYSAALGFAVAATNLQRVLSRRGQLIATGTSTTPGVRGGRPARRYRFKDRHLVVTDPAAVLGGPSS